MTDAASIVSDVGTGVAALLMASQMPVMYTVITKTHSVAHISVLPTVGQFSNFLCWVVYGLVAPEMALLRVNGIGVGFALIYITIFLIYAKGAHWWQFVYTISAMAVLFGGAFAGVIVPDAVSHDLKVQLLGYLAVACNVAMYGENGRTLLCAVVA